MENRGGKRIGSGRPSGATNLITRDVRNIIDECIDIKEVVNKLIELVYGVEVQEKIGRDTITYTCKPDAFAAKILLEYRFGKPSQQINIDARQIFYEPRIDISKDGDKINLSVKQDDTDSANTALELPT